MAATLPRPTRLKLAQTLAQWRRWQTAEPLAAPPRVVRALGDGESNYTVLVESAGRYVVRIDGVNPAAHGLNRQGEWRTLQTAHAAGVAPRPCYFNPDLGSLVCEYLEYRGRSHQEPEAIAELLRRIHRLPACHSRLEHRERILRYEQQLAHRRQTLPEGRAPLRPALLDCLDRAVKHPGGNVLCHNDLLRANRIACGEQLRAIDWEYCAMGNPLYDLAVVICGDQLDRRQGGRLVESYLGRSPTREESRALLDYAAIYRYLALLWYLAQDHPAMNAARLTRDVGRLAAALERAATSP